MERLSRMLLDNAVYIVRMITEVLADFLVGEGRGIVLLNVVDYSVYKSGALLSVPLRNSAHDVNQYLVHEQSEHCAVKVPCVYKFVGHFRKCTFENLHGFEMNGKVERDFVFKVNVFYRIGFVPDSVRNRRDR